MKVITENQSDAEVLLTIEASAEEMAQAKESAYRSLAPHVAVRGFRPGKAPRGMIERQIGQERLLTEALSDLLPRLYAQALEQARITPFADADMEIVQRDPAILKALVPLPPVVTLGDYRSVRLTREPVVVDDSEIDEELEELRERAAEWVPVAEPRPVRMGDRVVFDLRASSNGNMFIDRHGVDITVSEERGFILPGFVTELVGCEQNVERVISMTLPETFSVERLRGQPAEFAVTIREIKEKRLHEVDEEFAKEIAGLSTLEELRERLRRETMAAKEAVAEERFEQAIVNKLLEISRVDLPHVLVDEEIALLERRQIDRMREDGLDLDTYLKLSKQTREQFRAELAPSARKRVATELLLNIIAEAEGITVDASEVDAEIARASEESSEGHSDALKHLSSETGRRAVTELLRRRKALERLKQVVSTEQASEGAPEEPAPGEASGDTPAEAVGNG